MLLPDWHVHVSERQPGAWTDCSWMSAVEFVRLTHDRAIPATHAEGDAMRAASGDLVGGSNAVQVRTGIKRRYGYEPPQLVAGWANLWAALRPGTAAVVQGTMKVFGPGHTLSRWDPSFDGGHSVCVMRLDASDRVWWCDPLAPKGTYKGEWVSKATFRAFIINFAGQHLVAPILAPPPPPPAPETDPMWKTYVPGTVVTIKAASNIRKNAPKIGSPKCATLTVAEKRTVIGTIIGDVDPANGKNIWYGWYHTDHYDFTAIDNVTSVALPLDQAAVDRAVVAATAPLNARIAAAKTALG